MDFRDKVAQFVSITDSSEDIARKYLEACGGDLDMAIGMHLENQPSVATASTGDPAAAAPQHQNSTDLPSPKTYEKM